MSDYQHLLDFYAIIEPPALPLYFFVEETTREANGASDVTFGVSEVDVLPAI